MRLIDNRTVRDLVTVADLTGPMREALIGFSAGTVRRHPRVTVEPSDGDHILIMPAATATMTGLKMLTMFPRAVHHGLPSVQGLVILVDGQTGQPLSVLDATAITELRTAAVSAVATDRLARPDASTLAVIGAGVQGGAHLRALGAVRPWDSIRVFSRGTDRARRLVEQAGAAGLPVRLAASAAEAVAGADVICTATSDCSPVLPDTPLTPGAHITAVGAFGAGCRELPTELVVGADLFADSRDAVLAEAGDVLIPLAEGKLSDPDITEIGAVLGGRHPGRADAGRITVFKSLGLPIEDVVACELVYRRAVAAGAGQEVEFN
jgi:ornithine cyclodeaminase/alanine dehydrogenase-like protein (mu-crystallin family)